MQKVRVVKKGHEPEVFNWQVVQKHKEIKAQAVIDETIPHTEALLDVANTVTDRAAAIILHGNVMGVAHILSRKFGFKLEKALTSNK